MSANTKQSGVWDPVKNIYARVNGTWTLMKKAFVNVGGVWKQFHGGNAFEIYVAGLEENMFTIANKGLWINGVQSYVAQRSYNLVTFDKYGNVLTSQGFDVFGDGAGNGGNAGSNTQNLVSAMAAVPIGTPYLLFTFDEPNTNASYLTTPIKNYLTGVTSILSASVPYRGAYLLMGIAGQAPCLETYCGTFYNSVSNHSASTQQTDAGCSDAALAYTFRIFNGQIVNVTQQVLGGSVVVNSSDVAAPTVTGLA